MGSSSVAENGTTADPSTALRSGRDDKGRVVTFLGICFWERKVPQLRDYNVRALARTFAELGGADRDRTGDPLLAKQVLSQLSYSPLTLVVGLGRFELPTSPLSGVRSNQLSYRPAGCARVS